MRSIDMKNNFAVKPQTSFCFNCIIGDTIYQKTAWIVPHVIRHKEVGSDIISWRCNGVISVKLTVVMASLTGIIKWKS